jgi:hypothetical protein
MVFKFFFKSPELSWPQLCTFSFFLKKVNVCEDRPGLQKKKLIQTRTCTLFFF